MKKKSVKLQLHRGSVINFIYTKDSDEITSIADGLKAVIPGSKAEGQDALFIKAGSSFYVLFHQGTSDGEIAQEVTHFLNSFCSAINQRLDPDNDELYCYILTYFIDECLMFKRKCEKELSLTGKQPL